MKKGAAGGKGKGASKGAKSGGGPANASLLAAAVAKRHDEVVAKSLDEIRRRLWVALPSIAQVLSERAADGGFDSYAAHDDEAEAKPDPVDQMTIPWSEMESVVHCLFLATHSNPTADDAQNAVATIMGTPENPARTMYTKADLFSFLDTVPTLWLPHYELTKPSLLAMPTSNPAVERAIKLLNNELIDCITMDEEPGSLLTPEEVLTLSNHYPTNPLLPKAASLRTPVESFVSFVTHPRHPKIYDRLWSMLQDVEDCAALSQEQFSQFVVWFMALHFSNATQTRSTAAAGFLFHEFLNVKGEMCIASFQRACTVLCARYAKRRDPTDYLAELLTRTATASGVEGELTSLSLASVDEAKLDAEGERRPLSDPEDLYLCDELRQWQSEAEILSSAPCGNRIAVYGARGVGKTFVGKALATHLNCVHLDVLELCVASVLSAASGRPAEASAAVDSSSGEVHAGAAGDLDQQVLSCVESGEPIPLSLQAGLLRRELAKPGTSSFRGFVFSDTILPLPSSSPLQTEEYGKFLSAAGLVDEAVPAVFIELKCQSAHLQMEREASLRAAREIEYASANAKDDAEAEKAHRDAEEKEMRASCQAIMEHLAELQNKAAAGADGAASPQEIAEAEQQAAEAQEILAQLDAERAAAEEERAAAKVDNAVDDDDQNSTSEEEREAKERHHLEVILRQLLSQGRQVLLGDTAPPAVEGSDSQAAQLAAAVPCWAPCVESANALNRLLCIDAVSPVAETVTYVTETLHLSPTVLPFLAISPSNNEASSRDALAAYEDALRSSDEEGCGRLLESAAAEQDYGVSPTFKRYCPVTYEEDGVLVEGAACFMCIYRGYQYFTTSRIKLKRFMENPLAYLRPKQSISNRQRVLLVAGDSLKDHLEDAKAFAGSTLVADLAEALQLTPLTLAEYAHSVSGYCDLRNQRRAVITTRREYEAAELEKRDERLEKRAKADSKKKKSANPAKPKLKKPSTAATGASAPTAQVPSQAVTNEVAAPSAPVDPLLIPTPMEKELQLLIDSAKEQLQDAVPVLVTLLAWDTTANDDVDMLLEERCMPETVVVLERKASGELSLAAADEAEEGREDHGDNEAESSPSATTTLLEKLSKAEAAAPRSGAAAAWKRKEGDYALPPQTFTTHSIFWNSSGDEEALSHCYKEEAGDAVALRHVLQQICPAAPRVEDGVVDEELGVYDEEEDEEEEESEADGEDDAGAYDDGFGTGANGRQRPLGAVPSVVKLDPKLKPRRQFLHQFGSVLEYCPVTLREKRLLVRGRTDLCVTYMKKLYCFADEESKEKFALDPMRYTLSNPPRDVPPRLWVIGADLSGKRTLATGLEGAFGVHYFAYDRKFFEGCVEAVQKPGGGTVNGVVLPEHAADHPYVVKAAGILKEVRDFAAEQEKGLKLRAAAEAMMEERERKEAERAEREADGDYTDEDEEEELDEAKEAELQDQLEFEPEDPENAQERLTEAYLRMASCVTRFEPFESDGYVMVSPPFSEADLEVLFAESCIPEAVVHLELSPEAFEERRTHIAKEQAAAREARATALRQVAASTPVPAAEEQKKMQAETKRREKALLRWRRRHIGADDPDVPSSGSDADANPAGEAGGAEDDEEGQNVAAEPGASREDQLEAVTEFIEAIKERLVPVFKPNANVAQASVLRAATTALSRHLTNRLSFFHSVEVVEYDKAVEMLQNGRINLSSFGRVDPVSLFDERGGKRRECVWKSANSECEETMAFCAERENTLPPKKNKGNGETGEENADDENDNEAVNQTTPMGGEDAGEEEEMSEIDPDELDEMKERLQRRRLREWKKQAPRCGVLGSRLYFFKNDETLGRFVANPLTFAEAVPPLPVLPTKKPVVALFIDDVFRDRKAAPAVSLGEAAATVLDAVLIDEASLLVWAAAQPDVFGSFAAQALSAALGCGVESDFIAQLLVARLGSAEVKRKGAVLVNLPKTPQQLNAIVSASGCCAPIDAAVRLEQQPASGSTVSPIDYAGSIQQLLAAASRVTTQISVPFPGSPSDPANLAELVRSMDAVGNAERTGLLRRLRAFPVDVRNTHKPAAWFDAHLSPYQWHCPYAWVEDEDLVFIRPDEAKFCAEYLGECYVFKEAELLARFLENPQEVADPSTLRPLPRALPRPASYAEVADTKPLALKGCCPVLLYDTRDRRGLRGVVEPVAKVGSRDCVVEYDGQFYACLDEENKQRFLKRPWQYTGEAALPSTRKCPLTGNADTEEERAAAKEVSDEDFMRRQLYDAVARAMIAVADARPHYPGLSDEESALKFVALHMKAHRESNDAVQQQQYAQNYSMFHMRSTLYKRMVTAAADQEKAADFDELCASYEMMQNGVHDVSDLGHLKKV